MNKRKLKKNRSSNKVDPNKVFNKNSRTDPLREPGPKSPEKNKRLDFMDKLSIQKEAFHGVILESSPYIAQLTHKFFARAAIFRKLSTSILVFTGILILSGIICFLFPSSFTDIGSLQRDMDSHSQKIRKEVDALSKAYETSVFTEDVFNLYGILYEFKQTINNRDASAFPQKNVTRVLSRVVSNALQVADQLAKTNPEKIELFLGGYDYHIASKIELTPAAFNAAKTEMEGKGIDVDSVFSSVKELKDRMVKNDKEGIKSALINADGTLSKIGELRTEWKEKLTNAELEKTDTQRNRRKIEKNIQESRESINRTLLEAIKKGAASPESTWIPQLTIRVGVVILLLFFSAILFSTFRYTLTLSAYYTARGDALLMLLKPKNQLSVNAEELKTLLPLLSPDSYKVENVAAPYESISKLKP